MCNEREQLIAYLYDEVTTAERQAVDAHLAACDTCREELRAFRSVRQDLLAFDVPEHESVWKPFVAARPQPIWRQMPAWSLAAAAMVMFAIGGAGGFAGRVLASRMEPPAQVASAATSTAPAAPANTATRDDVRELETRLASLEHDLTSRAVPSAQVVRSSFDETAFMARVNQLIKDAEGRVSQKTATRLISIAQELQRQRAVESEAFEQRLNEFQDFNAGNLRRVMNSRDKEKE